MSKPLKGFITYSHEDAAAKDELRKRLAVMEQKNEFTTWHDGKITAGDKWYEDITKNLGEADILLYLVSAASLASKNCNKELAEALKKDIKVISIILEHCDWQHHQLSDFEVFPLKGKPISKWNDRSEGRQDVVDGIRKAIHKIQSQANSARKTSGESNLADSVFQRGNFLMMIGQIDLAITAYSDVIELDQRRAVAYCNRGIAYCHKSDDAPSIIEDLNKAIENFNKAIELNPHYLRAYSAASDTHYQLAKCYYGEDNDDLAIKNYTKAIQLQPDYAEAYFERGIVYYDKRDYEGAIKDYTKAIELSPTFSIVYYSRGTAYHSKGEFKLAIKDYTEVIELNPKLTIVYYDRGEAWLHLQEWEKAKLDLKTARNMGEDITSVFHNSYSSMAAFEQKHNVKLPEDIAALLTPPQV